LEKRAEQVMLGYEGGLRRRQRGKGAGGEMVQTMYAYMNK
jgi:hypothetical protein